MWLYAVLCLAFGTLVSAQVDSRCQGGRMQLNEVFGYLSHPSRCDAWIRCTFAEDNTIQSMEEYCGCGTFWDDSLMTCTAAGDVACANDLCGVGNPTAYRHTDNCRTYWMCDGSRTGSGACCPAGQGFNPSAQACQADNSCTDECLCEDRTTTATPACPFQENPNDPHVYYFPVFGTLVPMPCAPGTNFNLAECKCNEMVEIIEPPCSAEFALDCNGVASDIRHQTYIRNDNVGFNNNRCVFGGSSGSPQLLMFTRFAFQDFRANWGMKIDFNGGNNQNNDVPLASNSACFGGQKSIDIRLDRDGGGNPIVRVSVSTTSTGSVSTTVPYRLNEDNSLRVSYNGETVVACIRYSNNQDDSSSVAAEGLTRLSRCAIEVGQDEQQNTFFNGEISAFDVHTFCIPDNFCS